MVPLIDSHAHLNDRRFEADREEVLARAREAGLAAVVNVGFDLPSSAACLELAGAHPFLYAAVGVHPHDAGEVPPDYLERLRELARKPKVVALGEMGLDYYRNLSPRAVQEKVFREQLALARELDLPVIIHDREAHAAVLGILRKDGLGRRGGVMHCFSGDWELARECLELGLYISLAGPVTYPNAQKTREVAARVPLERLLIETDCPYLPPQPWRGRRNEPAFLRCVVEEIAALRGLAADEVAAATAENSRLLFGLPGTS
ncbi:TatD family hydrolase [Desulfovirgula thermocuniculi]|uniref:TatD family hydrolase n=1 Tax=Desulfovirgula thermocuniculi TaxID=348842 RepID=UPI00041F40F7|nr:TatD family hydrolase [Desulfovirgula thermocuniculi]